MQKCPQNKINIDIPFKSLIYHYLRILSYCFFVLFFVCETSVFKFAFNGSSEQQCCMINVRFAFSS